CGYRSESPLSTDGLTQAFVQDLTTGILTDIGLYNGNSTWASFVNDAGVMTGSVRISGLWTAFLWQNGTFSLLGTPPGLASGPDGLQQNGNIVGEWTITTRQYPYEASRGFLWQDGSITHEFDPLPGDATAGPIDINASGIILGGSAYFESNS